MQIKSTFESRISSVDQKQYYFQNQSDILKLAEPEQATIIFKTMPDVIYQD